MRRSLSIFLLGLILTVLARPGDAATLGTVAQTFNGVNANRLLADPDAPYVFASLNGTNAVDVFNSQTLSLVTQIAVGSNPEGMAVSPDGSTLYVADSGANAVSVVNLNTLTFSSNLTVSVQPNDIQAGNNNQLYLLGNGVIQPVSALTGANSGSSQGAGAGQIKLSSNGNTMVFGNTGVSPGQFNEYALANGAITSSSGFEFGGNDRALALASDGSYFTFASAGSPYQIPVRSTNAGANFPTLGTLDLGGPPQLITLSPDNKLAYVITTYVDPVYVFNMQTFNEVGTFDGPGSPADLVTDNSGQYLFVADPSNIMVYATGVPEPSALALLAVVAAAMLVYRPRRSNLAG